MKLVSTTDTHLRELMSWFPDQGSCIAWGSPAFRFPFTKTTFREDTRLDLSSHSSYSWVGDNDELLGFGQYYLRVDRCHLALLVIAPNYRGRGFGEILIHALARRGCRQLGVEQCALFVFSDNSPAISLYTRLGFVSAEYPGDMPDFEGCIYMVASPDMITKSSTAAQQKGVPGNA